MSKSSMVTARDLREMKSKTLGEDVVDLSLALHLTMVDIIYSAKDGKDYCYIYGEDYYKGDTPESWYVLDCLKDLGYSVDKCLDWDSLGEPIYSAIISWR